MRDVVGGVIIEDNLVLLVRKKLTWLFPGGKPEKSESHEDCLRREIIEELSGTKISNIRPYKTIDGRAPHKGDVVRVHYYFAKLDGNIGNPSGEIIDYIWTGVNNSLNKAASARLLLEELAREGYLT